MKAFRDKRGGKTYDWDEGVELRKSLLEFIADFANWDNSTNKDYLETSRALTQVAHESLGGEPGTRPMVIDPFAGGGSIPLEALRIGADAFASDLNPVAVLLNKVVLEYIPKYGQRLADEVRKGGEWIKKEAEKELAEFYPKDTDGATPIAYLWARTIKCEGPGCGAELPMIGQVWLSKKDDHAYAFGLRSDKNKKQIIITVLKEPKHNDLMHPISQKSSATCPLCNFTTPAKNVRRQMISQHGGSRSARLLAVVTIHPARKTRTYRMADAHDYSAITKAKECLFSLERETLQGFSLIPHEACPPDGALGFRFQKYGITKWTDLYTPRQLVALATFAKLVCGNKIKEQLINEKYSKEEIDFILTCLALGVGRVNDLSSTLCRWLPSLEAVAASNGGQNKMPMILDFVEANPIGGAGGDWNGQIDWIVRAIKHISDSYLNPGAVQMSAAQEPILPDDLASALFTDPPYYDAFGYSDLSEFFYPWLRRAVPQNVLSYSQDGVPKKNEIITINKLLADSRGEKTDNTYQKNMTMALDSSRRVVRPDGIGVVVFANKSTKGWEAILQSIIDAGWFATASWPIDTERPNRQRAIGSAALQSSIHLVCRPRENPDGSLNSDEIGDWRDVLAELPKRIHEWMPRLAEEGVVGADAIFACLGPALEIFSRYSRVEKASGEVVPLKEYLEYVWAAVAKEALSMIFEGAETTGFEEDARLTAMWLWTLSTDASPSPQPSPSRGEGEEEDTDDEGDKDASSSKAKLSGYTLEYDAARKIAQGLGAHLERLQSLVEIKGDKARLLPVAERTRALFGKDEAATPKAKKKKKEQLSMFAEIEEAEESGTWGANTPLSSPLDKGGMRGGGNTTLDRLHQSMILFAAGRGEALKRFLVEEGVGRDERFWRLAQAFSALYPKNTDEKRWVDGVLARKKGLGL